MAKRNQKANLKPKAKAPVKKVVKPAPKPKPPVRKPAARAAIRQQAQARQFERKPEPVTAPAQPAPSKGFFYEIMKFFWLLFHPGKIGRDFDAQYKG